MPIVGELRFRRRSDGAVSEVPPDHCPQGHVLGRGRITLGWNPITRTRTYTCRRCARDKLAPATWSVADPPALSGVLARLRRPGQGQGR